MGLLDDTARSLIPDFGADPKKQYRWRLRMALVVCITFLGLNTVTLLAFGGVPTIFAGFATTESVQQLASDLNRKLDTVAEDRKRERARNIDKDVLDLRTKHCDAKSVEARQLYWSKISELVQEYATLTGKTYPLPSCADLR